MVVEELYVLQILLTQLYLLRDTYLYFFYMFGFFSMWNGSQWIMELQQT